MQKYRWDELEEHMITPGKSVGKGQTVYGNMVFLQQIEYKENRGDGKIGAYLHHHPEEQFFIVLEGGMNIKEDSKWTAVHPGEIYWIPAYKEHETVWGEGGGLTYNFKTRVPGHSWYDGSWQP